MRTLPLLIIVIIIFAIVCSPALAISKSELISQYKTGYFPGPTTPTPMPTTIRTTGPTHIPTGTGTGTLFVKSYPSGANVYLDGEWKGVTPEWSGPSYAVVFSYDDTNALTLTGIPAGPHQLKVTKEGFPDYITRVTVTGGETIYVTANLVQIPPDPTPTVIPTTVPTPAPSNWPYPIVPDSYIKTKGSYLDSLSEYFPKKSETIKEMIFGDSTALSMKPNIYLYSNRDLVARVQLAPESAITVSEPLYQPGKGWRAEIRNGSLNGKGDFLFYEAVVPDSVWQKERGYVIRATYREQDMASMLGQYGFNGKETVEFIEYWSQNLAEDVDYVFYPQGTGAVDRVMPLSVIPEPDYVSRIWFYAEPFVSTPEPVTSPETIVRDRFYVVEWGVVM